MAQRRQNHRNRTRAGPLITIQPPRDEAGTSTTGPYLGGGLNPAGYTIAPHVIGPGPPSRVNSDVTSGIPLNDDLLPLRAVNETVRLAQQGDAEAFRALYEANVGRVYAVCLRLAGDQAAAEEHAQDVFVRAWQRLHTFRGQSAFSTWLYRLTVNEVLQARRAGGRRSARVQYTDEPDTLQRPTASTPTHSTDLERAIATLPEGARTVFVLYDIEGYQHEEIARLTGIAEGTSKAQLHRARRLLREALER